MDDYGGSGDLIRYKSALKILIIRHYIINYKKQTSLLYRIDYPHRYIFQRSQ